MIRLKELELCSNPYLCEIYGMNNIMNLDSFVFHDNSEYKNNSEIVDLMIYLASNDKEVYADIMYYLDIIKKEPSVLKNTNFRFEESINYLDNKIAIHTPSVLEDFYNKAFNIIEKYINPDLNDFQKLAIILEWMMENIKYDYSYGNGMDVKTGSNSVFNGFAHKTCVCEGYAKMCKIFFNILDIPTNIVYCTAITDTSRGGHALINNEIDGRTYYSDITWASQNYQKSGTRPWLLLSHADMSKKHEYYYDKETLNNNESIAEEAKDNLFTYAHDRIKTIDNIVNRIESIIGYKLTSDYNNLQKAYNEINSIGILSFEEKGTLLKYIVDRQKMYRYREKLMRKEYEVKEETRDKRMAS